MYFMNMLLLHVSLISIISLTGKWLPEEEKRLCDAVYELSGTKQGNHCFTVADIIVFIVKICSCFLSVKDILTFMQMPKKIIAKINPSPFLLSCK